MPRGNVANFGAKICTNRKGYSEKTKTVAIPLSQVEYIKRIARAIDRIKDKSVLEKVAAQLEQKAANQEVK